MVISQYGIQFTRVQEDRIELVRQWRNSDHVCKFMPNQQLISPEKQKRWFQTINNKHNLFFIISTHGEDAGCVNIRDIDYEAKTGIPGVFIGEQKYQASPVAVISVFMIVKFGFLALGFKTMGSPVLASHKAAIQLYKTLGFTTRVSADRSDVLNTFCDRKDFLGRIPRLEQMIKTVAKKDSGDMVISDVSEPGVRQLIRKNVSKLTGIVLQ